MAVAVWVGVPVAVSVTVSVDVAVSVKVKVGVEVQGVPLVFMQGVSVKVEVAVGAAGELGLFPGQPVTRTEAKARIKKAPNKRTFISFSLGFKERAGAYFKEPAATLCFPLTQRIIPGFFRK